MDRPSRAADRSPLHAGRCDAPPLPARPTRTLLHAPARRRGCRRRHERQQTFRHLRAVQLGGAGRVTGSLPNAIALTWKCQDYRGAAMRFGIVAIPTAHEAGGLFERAIGFAAARRVRWASPAMDHRSSPRRRPLDPLLFLGALCQATERIELGTCVTEVPLRHPVEQAHRAQTVNLLSRGRFRFGVGGGLKPGMISMPCSGLSRPLQDAAGSSRGGAGGMGGRTSLRTRPESVARHQERRAAGFCFGAWREPSLDRPCGQALRRLDRVRGALQRPPRRPAQWAWTCSARPVASAPSSPTSSPTCVPDTPAHPLNRARAKTTLVSAEYKARDRLRRIADLGFDDALLIVPFGAPEMLDGIRDLCREWDAVFRPLDGRPGEASRAGCAPPI